MRFEWRFGLLGGIFFAPCLWAQEVAEKSAEIPTGIYWQAFLSMIFILAILIFAAWLLRRLSGGKGLGNKGLQVVGGVALGPRERIVLIEVGDECLVVGIVPGQIRTLHRLPKSQIQLEETEQKSFSDWLKPLQVKK